MSYGIEPADLSDVTIGVTSFLRPNHLQQAVEGVRKNFPECKLAVADDSGDTYHAVTDTSIYLPFDSGLCKKRNALIAETDTKYFLLGSDDFVFDQSARFYVDTMLMILKINQDVDVVGGRVNNKPYEGFLEYRQGQFVRETRLLTKPNQMWYDVDITANYFLARTESIVPWQDELKIGGEHALWFLRMKQAGRRIVWATDVNINTATGLEQDPRYIGFRRRAIEGHRRMKEILGIEHYIDFNGQIS